MYKIVNISSEPRKFRVHKTAEGYYLRPGEEVIVAYPIINDRPDIFKVINLDEDEQNKSEVEPDIKSKKRTKSSKEEE